MSIRCCCTSGCCSGASIPSTLFIVANAGSGTAYIGATLTLGPSPIGTGGTGWWSGPLTDPTYGFTYYYQLIQCFGVFVYVKPTTAFTASSEYILNPAAGGNTCSPLSLSAGTFQVFTFLSFTQYNFANFTVHA